MAATTAKKAGITDNPAGAGILEYQAFQGAFPGLMEAAGIIPVGDPWQIKGSLLHTPVVVTDTLPPSPILGWKVPSGKALLWTGGVYHTLAAATEYVRVCRRYFLYGWQALAQQPPSLTTTVLTAIASTAGLAAGTYYYLIEAFDTFHRSASNNGGVAITVTANQAVTVTVPALPTGAVGFHIYRTLVGNAGGGPYYYIGSTLGSATYTDAQPDSAINPATNGGIDIQSTSGSGAQSWNTGAILGETMDGPGEIIIEVGAQALTAAPTRLVYTADGKRQSFAVTWPTAIGARLRAKLFGETTNFIATPTLAANLWRGPFNAEVRSGHEHNLGATSVDGVNAGPTAGSFIVWGQQVIGTTERQEATAAIKASRIVPIHPNGVLLPENSEIVVEIGALALGVAAVRDVTLFGCLLPMTAT